MTQKAWDAAPFLEKVVGVVPGIIYVFNQKTQSNEYSNKSLGDVLGYDKYDMAEYGADLMPALCHRDDLAKVLAHFDKIAELPDNTVAIIEYRMRHKAGHWVWLQSHDSVFERDSDGAVLRHIGLALDVTENNRQRMATSTAQGELETIFNTASCGILAFDTDGAIVRLNDPARQIIGATGLTAPFDWPDDFVFLDPNTLAPLDPAISPLGRALTGETLQDETCVLRHGPDRDQTRYVRVGSAPVDVAGSSIHVVMVIDDVTGIEHSRQAMERHSRLDALGQLTGGIAHDFNNVLASLLYAVDLAAQSDDPAKRDLYLKTAGDTISRGSQLTNRLLAFAKRQPGLAEVRLTHEVLDAFVMLVRPMVEANIDITVDVADKTLSQYCDPTQLETALMNLVLNARDALTGTETGTGTGQGGRISIQARAVRAPEPYLDRRQKDAARSGDRDAEYRYVEISVSDNGSGMDRETLQRSTDPFFTTKHAQSGTGLGLAMVYGFAAQSDGELRLYSEPGLGTTVRMILPCGTFDGARELPIPPADLAPGEGQCILLVEDEADLAAMLADVLTEHGYTVVTAPDGDTAWEKVMAGLIPDLLLTDVVVPGEIGGFDLAHRVRGRHPDLPVIYMSGYTGFTMSEMGAVPARLLQKPASPAELSEAVSQALGTNIG